MLVVLLALVSAMQIESATEANPIRRIVSLLQNMQTQVKEEGEKEKQLYEKFMCYCKSNTGGLSKDIEQGIAAVQQLRAEADAKKGRKQQLDQELVEHKSDREEAKAAIAKATNIRNKEHEEYVSVSGEKGDYIEGLNKAIKAIRQGMSGKAFMQTANTASFVQKALSSSTSLSEMDRQTVTEFLSGPYGDYHASSGEIVGILEQLHEEINKDLGGVVTAEEAAAKSYKELMAAKKAEIAAASAAIEKKSVRSGELAVEITQAKNGADNSEKERAANVEFLANLAENCKTKTAEYDERVATRNDELVSISEAVKVLNDDDALDIFKNTLPSGSSPAFLQKVDDSRGARKAQAYAWLQQASIANKSRSPQLNLLSYMLRAGKVDFSKVLKLIDDMIAHLGQEQIDDDHQRDWCTGELDTSDDKKKALTRKVRDETAAIDEATARVGELTENVEMLSNKISELDQAVAEATEQRKKENAEFIQTSTELNAAQQLLEKAKNRLNKFYNPKLYNAPPTRELTEEERIARNMGEEISTAAPKEIIAGTEQSVNFLQIAKPEQAPATWAAGGYQKKGQKSGGVIALMDMMLKDVSQQMIEGKKDEEKDQENYEKLVADAKATREQDSRSLADKKSAHAETNSRLNDGKQARRAVVAELGETNKYISNLHGSCTFLMDNHAFRKEARAQEKSALVNAKAVLNGANYQ